MFDQIIMFVKLGSIWNWESYRERRAPFGIQKYEVGKKIVKKIIFSGLVSLSKI